MLSVLAAFFQNLRSALQKHLKGKLTDTAAAFTRFLFALPFAWLYLLCLKVFASKPLPSFNLRFLLYCLSGSIAQILFTVVLLRMFSYKSFVVGTTLSKLEVVVVAVLGVIILQDKMSALALTAILICTVGVVTLNIVKNRPGAGKTREGIESLIRNTLSTQTWIGLLCAFFLGASVVLFRGASLSLIHDDVLMSAAVTLAVALSLQTLMMGCWIAWHESDQWTGLAREWRGSLMVGIAGVLASICWFTAFTLQNASFVRAVGMIELVFAYLFSTSVFKEKVRPLELTGILLILAGILLLLTAA